MVSLHPLGTLQGTEFSEIMDIYFSQHGFGKLQFLNYFEEFLENPERSGTHAFDQQRYVTASKECLQLYLCSHLRFSKGSVESAHRDNMLRRSKPSLWRTRLGPHSRIRKARHHIKVWKWKKLLKTPCFGPFPFPENSLEVYDYYRSLLYRWALDHLPSFLEKSAISLELAEILHHHTFTTMAQKFPRRIRLAKDTIRKYLLRVESASGVAEL